ncbi:hypothetical protein SMD44_05418 [Streptomyces alboflavus]|uniref:Uncharacterized protein n=1 Tax=Streptomyces alboflavus TaxID=67267 RepID=A0A1Z1WHW1_9ACTN|nr:hypothetical protein SMD44_05418 [Streptomyces alboflavus]
MAGAGSLAVPELVEEAHGASAEEPFGDEAGGGGELPGRKARGAVRARAGRASRGAWSPRVRTARPVAAPRASRSIQATE